LPDLLTDFALVAVVFTVTALISGLWSTSRSILDRGLPWTEKRVFREDTAERVRGLYNYRRSRFSARFGIDEDGIEERYAVYQRLLTELVRAQCRHLIELRNEGVIGDEAMHRIERDLDLEESRLEA
jgi:hypothetical protein